MNKKQMCTLRPEAVQTAEAAETIVAAAAAPPKVQARAIDAHQQIYGRRQLHGRNIIALITLR